MGRTVQRMFSPGFGASVEGVPSHCTTSSVKPLKHVPKSNDSHTHRKTSTSVSSKKRVCSTSGLGNLPSGLPDVKLLGQTPVPGFEAAWTTLDGALARQERSGRREFTSSLR